MQPVEFPQQTAVLAKDQPQYTPLPVHVGSCEDGFPMTACFELSEEEKAEIAATGKFWHTQFTFGHPFQPISLSTQNPFEKAPQIKISPIRALVKAFVEDPDYRETWKANIAMAFYDSYKSYVNKEATGDIPVTIALTNGDIHSISNKAADNFLNTLCAE